MVASMAMSRFKVDLPRVVLRADGALVATSAVGLIAGARPVSSFLGLDGAMGLVIVGVVFVPCAALLFWWAGRRPVARYAVVAAAVVNVAWVIGSVALLLLDRPELTSGGRWAVAVVAGLVALVGAAEIVALRRMG